MPHCVTARVPRVPLSGCRGGRPGPGPDRARAATAVLPLSDCCQCSPGPGPLPGWAAAPEAHDSDGTFKLSRDSEEFVRA
eukprot:132889-Rhodomonas_salina.2